MTTLYQALLSDPERGERLAAQCLLLIETQVASRPRVRRIALRAGMAVLNAIQPDAVIDAVRRLLPDFTTALDPLYQQFRQSEHQDFSPFLEAHPDEAVQALLVVTDRHVRDGDSGAVRAAYGRLRGIAETEVHAALPGLARVLSDHLPRSCDPLTQAA